jgi:hypothetical protein
MIKKRYNKIIPTTNHLPNTYWLVCRCVDDPTKHEVLTEDQAQTDERVLQQQTPLPEDQRNKWVEELKRVINFEITKSDEDEDNVPYAISYHELGSRYFLVTGGVDNFVRLWEYFPESPFVLLWSSCQSLCAIQTNITGATLSFDNHELLCQRGASGSARVLYDTSDSLNTEE